MERIIRRLHALTGITPPVPLEPILEREDIIVEPYDFRGRLTELMCQRVVLIRRELYENVCERRYLTAHALGHHFLHTGSFFSLSTQLEWWSAVSKEGEADRFAALLLCPGSARPVAGMEVWEAAELFEVPENLVIRRMSYGWR
jgi:hypothetical protein